MASERRATRLRLVRACASYVTRRVRAAVPGAVGARDRLSDLQAR
jgi:hypothetical protein